MIKIGKRSPVTGVINTMTLNVTNEQVEAWLDGMLIQEAMPNLEPFEREFLISGCTPEDWEYLYGQPE